MNTTHREMDEFPELKRPVIIATKGLPCTGKSEIANLLGKWARCTVLYIDDFLDAVSCDDGGYQNSSHSPSPDEADRLRRLAFLGLSTVALRHLRLGEKCIVVKSRLSSSFELNGLVSVAKASTVRCRVVVLEFRVKNEHRFRLRLDDKVTWYGHEEFWYKPRSWKDIENASTNECLDAQAWDLSIVEFIKSLSEEGRDFPWVVTRLVVDAFDDLSLTPDSHPLSTQLSPSFVDVFKYLLIGYEGEEDLKEERYVAMKFDELRRRLLEKQFSSSASKERSKYLCAASSRGCCVFKYREYSHHRDADDQDEANHYRCGVCKGRVFSCQAAYTCYFCTLALHQSCAELHGFNYVDFSKRLQVYYFNQRLHLLPEMHACKLCTQGEKGFSEKCMPCLFQTHLKCALFPTIINHVCHGEHFLSIEFVNEYACQACGAHEYTSTTYGCYLCRLYYHITCVFLPGEVMHNHGGHHHLMKLLYSRNGMEQEEDYWCDSCYRDMDPQLWFYSCQECPCYAAHLRCAWPLRNQLQRAIPSICAKKSS